MCAIPQLVLAPLNLSVCTVFIFVSAKKRMPEKKGKEDDQTLEELNSAHRHSQAKCEYKPVTLNELNCSCF